MTLQVIPAVGRTDALAAPGRGRTSATERADDFAAVLGDHVRRPQAPGDDAPRRTDRAGTDVRRRDGADRADRADRAGRAGRADLADHSEHTAREGGRRPDDAVHREPSPTSPEPTATADAGARTDVAGDAAGRVPAAPTDGAGGAVAATAAPSAVAAGVAGLPAADGAPTEVPAGTVPSDVPSDVLPEGLGTVAAADLSLPATAVAAAAALARAAGEGMPSGPTGGGAPVPGGSDASAGPEATGVEGAPAPGVVPATPAPGAAPVPAPDAGGVPGAGVPALGAPGPAVPGTVDAAAAGGTAGERPADTPVPVPPPGTAAVDATAARAGQPVPNPVAPASSTPPAAGQPAPTPASPAERVAAQLAAPIASLRTAAPGEHVMVVRVNPDTFGPVRVRAHIGADGVRIELLGATDGAREALKVALPDLRRDLIAAGLPADISLGSGRQSTGTSTGTDSGWGGSAPDRERAGDGGRATGGRSTGPGSGATGPDGAPAPASSGARGLDVTV